MPHFFIESNDITEGFAKIAEAQNYNHIVKALRCKNGESILLIDENQIQYEGEIYSISKTELSVRIKKSYPSARFLPFNLTLAQSPLKSDAQLLIIEKATELGVNKIQPILTDNCSVKKTVIEQKIPKWQKIAFEASKQCERANIPQVSELGELKSLCKGDFDRILAFTERSAMFKAKEYISSNPIKPKEKILVIIGPEGGFSQKEFDFLSSEKIITLSLGELILKAETAVITALGAIVL